MNYKFKKYHRSNQVVEMRPYVLGESLDHISVPSGVHPPEDMGMIAKDMFDIDGTSLWYVPRTDFINNFFDGRNLVN